jgi:hypothetical protein
MAFTSFEEWLLDFLTNRCTFSPEEALEIKDEIMKNIEWYQEHSENAKTTEMQKLIDAMKKMQPYQPSPNVPQPAPYIPQPTPTPWGGATWIGDLPRQWTTISGDISGDGTTQNSSNLQNSKIWSGKYLPANTSNSSVGHIEKDSG